MDRRHILFSGSALALLLVAPTAALALEHVKSFTVDNVSARQIAIAHDIDRAIDSLRNSMFMLTETKVILGVGSEPSNLMEVRFELHRLVFDEKNREVGARIGLVNAIHDRLSERSDTQAYASQIVWLHHNHPGVAMSPGVRMCSGYDGLLSVARELDPTLRA